MDNLVLLRQQMTRLKLTGLMDSYPERLRQATSHQWPPGKFLSILLADEIDRRNNKQLARRLTLSQLDASKSIEQFDFSFNRTIPENSFRNLCSCEFINEGENILMLGPSGVGKSHLAQALGHEACRLGQDVLFYRTAKMMNWISAGKGDGTHSKRLKQLIKVPLLILDDFGLEPISIEQQSDLYEIICERYEKKSTIVTSNRDLPEWISVFNSSLMGSAAMDRLVHRALKFVVEGDSYRTAAFINRNQTGSEHLTNNT